MGKKNLTFGDIEIEKHKFYHYESPIFLKKDVDINKILVSNKISSSEKDYKYFSGYLYDGYKIKALHIMLSTSRLYVKSYASQTIWMPILIEDDDLLGKYNTIWDKVSADIKKEFDSEPVHYKKFLKIKS